MNIITDRPIYSNLEGEEKLTPLGLTEIPSKLSAPTTMLTEKQKRQAEREKRQAERKDTRGKNKVERKDKRAERKARRQANRLLRAKDKTGKKRWFYPISRVFNGKKYKKDGTVEVVAASDIVTTSSGAQFDKKEIAAATGIPAAQVTAQTVEANAVITPANITVTENTTLSPFVAAPAENIPANTDPTTEQIAKMSTASLPIADTKEVTQTSDGATYLSEETIPMEEPEVDEDVNMRLKAQEEEQKKGLGVWGWVGISAIVVGLTVAGVLLYKMSASKNK
jgi:hypothetical protein